MSTVRLTCQELVEVVTDYLDGAMGPQERGGFEAHLSFCSWCTTYVEQMRATIALAGKLETEPLPDDVRGRLVIAFRARRGKR